MSQESVAAGQRPSRTVPPDPPDPSVPHPAAADPAPERGGPSAWAPWPFRITMSIATLMLFDQAVFAGQFLSGSLDALHTHRVNATGAGLATLAAGLAALTLRWPGRGPIWPVPACLGLFGLIGLQIALGFARLLTVHIPLGVTIIGLAVTLTGWAWRYRGRA